MGNKKVPKYVFHHTALGHLPSIMADGYLALSPSNLLPPDSSTAHFEPIINHEGKQIGKKYWDKNQSYKQVVWLTSEEHPYYDDHGLGPEKTAVTFVFRYQPQYIPWKQFADANRMDPCWRHALESGRKHRTWYVCRSRINISDAMEIRAVASDEDDERRIKQSAPTALIIRAYGN